MSKQYRLMTENEFCGPELTEFYACGEGTEQQAKIKESLRNRIGMKRMEFVGLRNQFNELASKICISL